MSTYHPNQEKSYISEYEVKWSLIIAVLMLIWILVIRFLNIHKFLLEAYEFLFYTPSFLIILPLLFYFALQDKRRNYYKRRMSWKKAFYSGVVLSAFVAVLTPFIHYVTTSLIFPNYFLETHKILVENNYMTLAEATDYFVLDSFQVRSAIGNFIVGVIISFILPFLIKKRTKIKKQRRKMSY